MLTPLPIAGYTDQPQERVDVVNRNKEFEEIILRLVDEHAMISGFDQRWVAQARTSFQNGFMQLNRAVFQPQRLSDVPLEDLIKGRGK